MGNIETTLNSVDSITIDISGITSEQRRLLAATIGWTSTIVDENNETVANPVPLIAAIMMDSMQKRKNQMQDILRAENFATAQQGVSEVMDTLL